MIAKKERPCARSVLRLGDEPAALARGRLLYEAEAARGRRPRLVFPAKGEAVPASTLDGEDAEWLGRHARGRIPPHRDWLRALAAVAEGRDPRDPPEGTSQTALREIAVLLASARRSAAHDLPYAFETLERPPDRVRRDVRLRAFREECARAVGAALRARPRFAWRVALLSFASAESVEDIVAARWRDQLSRHVVLAANSGHVAGGVTYAFRCAPGVDGRGILLAALPPGAPPPVTSPSGDAGRGMLDAEEFADLLRGLRFRRGSALLPG